MKKAICAVIIACLAMITGSVVPAQQVKQFNDPDAQSDLQKQLHQFYQSQLTPLTNTNSEIIRVGRTIWQRMAGENEYFLSPLIRDVDAYNSRIRSQDNKDAGIAKSVFKFVRIPLDQGTKDLLMMKNVKVPDYFNQEHLIAFLPVIDIDFLRANGIGAEILENYGKKPLVTTDQATVNKVIWSEGWEGSMTPYTIGNVAGSPGTQWKDVNCASRSGYWSLWCAGGGSQPQPYCASYVNNMNTYIYKTSGVDIRAYTNVKFKFYYKHKTEVYWDKFIFLTSIDGLYWSVSQSFDGTSAGYPVTWQSYETTFGNIWTLYFRFEFTSDYSNVDEGAFIDDLEVTGDDDCNSTLAYTTEFLTPENIWNYQNLGYVGGYLYFNVTAGTEYHWSLCPEHLGYAEGFDSELILRDGATDAIIAYSDDVCGDDARISWTADFTGIVKIVVKKYHCTNWFPPGFVARLAYKSGPLEAAAISTSPPIMNFNPDTYFTYPESLQQITVTTNANIPWTMDVSESWILLPAGFTGGTGNTTLYVTCANNNTNSTRAGMINLHCELGDYSILVQQREGCTSFIMHGTDTTSFTMTDNWQFIDNIQAGEYVKFYLPRGPVYTFSLCPQHGGNASFDSQLTIRDINDNVEGYSDDVCGDDAIVSNNFSPFGNVVLQYKVIINQYNCSGTTNFARLAYKQGVPEDPVITAAPQSFSVGSPAGSVSFNITSNTTWTIIDNASWISANPVSGSGNGTITVTYQANTGVSRYGDVMVLMLGNVYSTVTVNQAEAGTPQNLQLQNMNVSNPPYLCFAAVQTISLAGGGNYFTVSDGGNVELIAGHNILMNPGTSVINGGHLYGHISGNGTYCPTQKDGLSWIEEDDLSKSQIKGGEPFFRVYPNPTSGNLTIELADGQGQTSYHVEVYGIMGEKQLKVMLPAARYNQLDLSGKKPGLYLIKIIYAEKVGYEKIVIH